MVKSYIAYDTNRVPLRDVVPLKSPFRVTVSVSNLCNFKCKYCIQSASSDSKKKSGLAPVNMSWSDWTLLMEQISRFSPKIKRLSLAGLGEPLMNPLFPDMVADACNREIAETVMLTTNGALLTPAVTDKLVETNLSHLLISVQGLTSEAYREITGVNIDFETVYENAKYFSAHKKPDCQFWIKIVDDQLQQGDATKFHQLFDPLCDAVGIEHIVRFNERSGVDSEYSNRWHSEINPENTKVCTDIFFSIVVMADGSCSGCWFGAGSHLTDFNIHTTTLSEYWNSAVLDRLRFAFLKGDLSEYPACDKCSYKITCNHPDDRLDGAENEILARMGIGGK